MDPPAAGGGGAGAAANANGLAPLPLPLPQVAAAADHDAAGGGGAGAVANANGLAPLPLPLPQVAAAADHDGGVVEEHLDGVVVGDQPAAPANPAPEAEEEEGHHDGAVVEEHLAAGVVRDQLLALAPAAPANPVHPQPQDALVHQQLLAVAPLPPPLAALEELPVVDEHGLAPPPPPLAALEELPVVDEHGLAPPPPPPAALEELPVVDEHGVALPPPPPIPAAAQMDWIGLFLAGVTVSALCAVLMAEIGVDVTSWVTTLEGMTAKKWALAVFITIGDLTSLFLTYAPAWKFWGMWRREGAGVDDAGLATMVPPIVALVSSGVWVLYGVAVPGRNWSVIIINGIGAVFQGIYATVFCARSEAPWRHKVIVVLLGAGVGAVIAIVDFFLLYAALGLATDSVIGWSGAATTSCTYLFGCALNMSAAARTRGVHGVPAQAWASLANAGVWFVVATLSQDWRMLVPNVVGIGCFIAQAGQLIHLRCRMPPMEESEGELEQGLLEQV